LAPSCSTRCSSFVDVESESWGTLAAALSISTGSGLVRRCTEVECSRNLEWLRVGSGLAFESTWTSRLQRESDCGMCFVRAREETEEFCPTSFEDKRPPGFV
jgi:hypothetical protein